MIRTAQKYRCQTSRKSSKHINRLKVIGVISRLAARPVLRICYSEDITRPCGRAVAFRICRDTADYFLALARATRRGKCR